MSYKVRPISDRTAFTGRSRRSQFDSSWSSTESLLLREVSQLRGRDLVIEADVSEADIRIDGQMRANARPSTPAVRVAFESKHGPLVYATDRFDRWYDNVRAIALGLEALRKVDRYGITKRGEQYAGWKAIEATPAGMGRDAACSLLARVAWPNERVENREGWAPKVATDPEIGRNTWKLARTKAHPDRNDGDRTLWDQVEQAARVLGLEAAS